MKLNPALIYEYLKSKEDAYPSYEDFVTGADKEKSISMFTEDLGEYKGYINTFSKKGLNNKIASGGRNTSNLLTLLRSLEDIQDKQTMQEPVKIVSDLPATKKGTHARVKIKQPNSR